MSDLDIIDTKAAEPKTSDKQRAAPAKKGLVRIVIPKTERDKSDVYVNANFQSYQIKRGVPVDVPQAVVDALNLAVETRYYEEVGDDGRKALVPQQVLAYPFQTL